MIQPGLPFGVPARQASPARRRYMMSTPPCVTSSPAGDRRLELYPSLISGLRSCQTPTGHTHRPGSGSGRDPSLAELEVTSVEDAALLWLSAGTLDASRPRYQWYATRAPAPPPRIQGNARMGLSLLRGAHELVIRSCAMVYRHRVSPR